MSEARSVRDVGIERILLAANLAAYELIQCPSGKAGIHDTAIGKVTGDYADLTTIGTFNIAKTTSMVLLKGCRVYWDHSANACSYRKNNDRDFYVGRAAEDATSSAPTCAVLLNEDPPYDLDLLRDPYITVPVGTQALGGFLPPALCGGCLNFVLTSTNEAQKVDALSVDGFATGANAIVEAQFRVVSDGAGTVVDVNIGIANDTHATDADSITESVFCHLDANNTNINFESDDGTVEVAATDSTTDYTEGATVAVRETIWFDMRDTSDVQIYRNGVLMLASTTFNVSVATGPWKLLVHVEKSSSTDTYQLSVDALRAWYAEQ